MYLLDTNILIYYFKNEGHVAERMLAVPPREIAISVLTEYEIRVGLSKSKSEKRLQQFSAFVESISVLPFSSGEAEKAAALRVLLERLGTPIGPIDTLIAGTALANNKTLITRNMKEFMRVPNLPVLDWHAG